MSPQTNNKFVSIRTRINIFEGVFVFCHSDEMKSKKYHTVETITRSNIKVVERDKIDTHNTHIHAHSLSWLSTGTSIKSGGAKLVLCAQTPS